jgi:DNA-binding MltR family transcriptional regulator
VLLSAAWLDDALTENLRKCLVDDSEVVDELFGVDRPLGTFSAKITMAYCLGLIDEEMRKDLDTIRGIRNDFGHVRDALSFGTQSMVDRCNNLATPEKLLEASIFMGMHSFSTVRDRFLISATLIVGYLIRVAGAHGYAPKGTDSAFRMYLDKLVEKGAKAQLAKLLDSLEAIIPETSRRRSDAGH